MLFTEITSSIIPLTLDPVPEILNKIEDETYRDRVERILEFIDKKQVKYLFYLCDLFLKLENKLGPLIAISPFNNALRV